MVDIKNLKVIVCLFGEEPDIRIYGFDEESIPIGISEGTCSIDFSRIYERAKNAGLLPEEKTTGDST